MSIEIIVRDPATTPPQQLRQIVMFLASMLPQGAAIIGAIRQHAGPGTIAAEDRPDAGSLTAEDAFTPGGPGAAPQAPEAVFNEQPGGPSPEAAFGGAGNVPGAPAVSAPAADGSSSSAPAPSVPVPPAAASSPAASPPPPPAGVTLDKNGLPWDARIHAKSSSGPGGVMNADGTWRAKRGLNDGALVARIEAELRAAIAAPGPVAGTPPAIPQPPAGNGVPLPPGAAAAAPASLAPAGASTPAAPATPAVGGQQPTASYVELVQQVAAAIAANKLTNDEVTAICQPLGIASLPLLATRLDLVSTVSSQVNACIAARG